MSLVFGPDTFTVGADTNIDAYPAGNPDYAYSVGAGNNMIVSGVNDRAESGTDTATARLIDASAPTGNQEVLADANTTLADYETLAPLTRMATTGNLSNWYEVDWAPSGVSELEITRVDNGVFTLLASRDGGLSGAASRRWRIRTTGTGATVNTEFQLDDARPLTSSDTSASRKTSGVQGMQKGFTTVTWLDNLAVDDLAATGFQARCGTLTVGTGVATTTYAAIGLGFQPKALILWWTRRNGNVNAAGDADQSSGFGVAVSTTDRRAIAWQADHAAADMSTDSYHSDVACVATLTTTGGVDGLADLSSLDADGFTLVVDDAFAAAISVNYLALGGADLTNAATGVFNEPGATGNHSEGALAFQPDFVMFFSSGIGAAPPGAAAHARGMVGAAQSSTARGVTVISTEDAVAASDTFRYSLSSECIAMLEPTAGAPDYREDFVAFTSTGFTLNAIEQTAGARRVHYLALAGGSYRVDNLLTSTGTGDIAETGFGFRPRGAWFASHCAAENTANTSITEAKFSMGAFDSQSAIDPARNRVCRCTKHEDASTASDDGDAMRFDAVYANILVTTAAIDALMDIKSVESDGFTCLMDDVETAAAFVWYVAFGDEPAAPGAGPPGEDDAFEDESVIPWPLLLGGTLVVANPPMRRRTMLGVTGLLGYGLVAWKRAVGLLASVRKTFL